jgi:2-polyprenyl-3-methyl-5-hydroxy-6-metoxy-1,4-benzoquinol methylase
MQTSLNKQILEANIELHRIEAKYYELLHQEIYNATEQKRVTSVLKRLDKLITDNQKKVLDFGAGTGNLTGKFLQMNYNVTAIDISPEMCLVLEKKYKGYLKDKLKVINANIDDVTFNKGTFDLIVCFSVLHHLPDYVGIIQKLSTFLKKGGVMYLDHERSPFFILNQKAILKRMYNTSNSVFKKLLRILYLRTKMMRFPDFDYSIADYWTKKEHRLDHNKIACAFNRAKFDFFTREDYYLTETWFSNPAFYIYKRSFAPDMSLWIAKK